MNQSLTAATVSQGAHLLARDTLERPTGTAVFEPQRPVADTRESAPEHQSPRREPRPLTPRVLKRRLVMADIVAIVIGYSIAFGLQAAIEPARASAVAWQVVFAAIAVPVIVSVGAMVNLYTARATRSAIEEFRLILVATFFGTMSTVMLAFVTSFGQVSRLWAGSAYVAVALTLAFERRIARGVFRRLRETGRLTRRTIIVGADSSAVRLARTMSARPDLGYTPVGFVGGGNAAVLTGLPRLGSLNRIEQIAADVKASGVVVSMSAVDRDTVNRLSRRLTDAGLHVTLSTHLEDIDVSRLRMYELDGQAMMYIEPTIRDGWRRTAKRAFDLSLALVGIVLTAPIVLGAMIAIRLDSKGPMFFAQYRVGKDGSLFRMIKLRTMVADAEERKSMLLEQNESDGPLFKIRDDPRITRVGRLLRKTSVDEFPQFWNVIRGEMSFVGPRPALPNEVEQWPEKVHERLRVLPGITGRWQVSGRSDTSFEEYTRLDLHYVDNWSLMHDIRIMVKTVAVVVRGSGAS